MARIRSIHPGQWSDEDFVALSFPARLLALALRNIADDHGVFEWKPRTIKMQLLPADAIDVHPLLSELVGNNMVLEFESGGKRYGAIRNFTKWQRPKKPSYQYPCSELVLDYVGLKAGEFGTCEPSDDASSPPVGNRFGTGSEIASQRKEEGGRKKEEKDSCTKPAGRISYPPAFEEVWKAYPTDRLMSKKDGYQAWKKLSDEDKALLAQSLPAFNAYCRSDPTYRPVHFARYITGRRFEGMADESKPIHARPMAAMNGPAIRDANGDLTNAALFGRG